jgi:23S rRNA A2030 N6-methylase RlmJ
MKANEIIKEIVEGNHSKEELSSILNAVHSAQDINRQRQTAIMKSTLRPGDKVTLSGLSPKAINGLIATVVEIKKTRVKVNMPEDYRAGRFSGLKNVGVPLACVSKQ